jgi:acetyl esterase/lipase
MERVPASVGVKYATTSAHEGSGIPIRSAGIDPPLGVAKGGPDQANGGAIMALDAVATGRWPVRAAVAASGRLATAPNANEHLTKILLMHGENDPVIPAQETWLAADRLRAAGFEVEAKLYPGLGHVLSAEGVQTAGKFLARQLRHA